VRRVAREPELKDQMDPEPDGETDPTGHVAERIHVAGDPQDCQCERQNPDQPRAALAPSRQPGDGIGSKRCFAAGGRLPRL